MVDFAYVSANRCISGLKEEGQLKRENCDVLVIGSGIGGLSAAAFLVASGYKTWWWSGCLEWAAGIPR